MVAMDTIQRCIVVMTSTLCLHHVVAMHLPDLKFATHPMLYYSPEDTQMLWSKASGSHKEKAALLQDVAKTMLAKPDYYLPPVDYKSFGGRWNEMYGNNLAALAMYCVLFPGDYKALTLVFEYMDRLTALPKWQVISVPDDEVPVAHSLTGFATAFDLLYPILDPHRRMAYLRKIITVTKEFYFHARHRAWGRFYLQNHVATNYLALIHGSLVSAVYYRPALFWLQFAIEKFELTMKLLNHIVDGSLDEGVPYGSYTSRSVTQYIFLMYRHFDIDHTKGRWIQQHFWYYYNTVMPHFQRTVGIGDSNNNWFYGPESQLVFLDAYVLKNGYGNWLAHEIRRHRTTDTAEKLIPAQHQLWCTLHTEFLWFDASITRKAPPQSEHPDLHVFSDWGVVTYSRVSPRLQDDTFFAFKSGKMHGRAVFDVVQRQMYPAWVQGWRSFNPGHEHPDQNMFVFAPGGQLFITDGLYAAKYTYLNNAISFYPSPTSRCSQPWEGQLGECGKYLDWKNPSLSHYGGELITANFERGMVFTSGEAVEAYSDAMELESVYRSLMLLNENVLVILDHVEAKLNSPISHFSAFFHNLVSSFERDQFVEGQLSGVKIATDKGAMRMFWTSHAGASSTVQLIEKDEAHTSIYQPSVTNYVNITHTVPATGKARVAYILLGPSVTLKQFEFAESQSIGATLLVETGQERYKVAIATDHNNPSSRQQYLGYPGFASVMLRNRTEVMFGINLTSGDNVANEEMVTGDVSHVASFLVVVALLCVALLMYILRNYFKRTICRLLFLVTLLAIWLMVILCMTDIIEYCVIGRAQLVSQRGDALLPATVITSLPGSGAELIGWLFYNNPDFAYVRVPSHAVTLPVERNFELNPVVDACVWMEEDVTIYPSIKNWLQALFDDLSSVLLQQGDGWQKQVPENIHQRDNEAIRNRNSTRRLLELKSGPSPDPNFKEYSTQDLVMHIRKFSGARTVLELTSGGWGLKLPWLLSILGNNFRNIHIVRDPRAWVANMLRNKHKLYETLGVQQEISRMFKQAHTNCADRGRYAEEYEQLRVYLQKQKGIALHLELAHLWAANARAVLRTVLSLPDTNSRLVRFEDLVLNSERTATLVYNFIGFPLRPITTHQLLQATHSDVYRIPYEGVISQDTPNIWQKELSTDQIKDIERVCGESMKLLRYDKVYAESDDELEDQHLPPPLIYGWL